MERVNGGATQSRSFREREREAKVRYREFLEGIRPEEEERYI